MVVAESCEKLQKPAKENDVFCICMYHIQRVLDMEEVNVEVFLCKFVTCWVG